MQISLESTATTENPYLDEEELANADVSGQPIRNAQDLFLRNAAIVVAETISAASRSNAKVQSHANEDISGSSVPNSANTQPILEQVKDRIFYAREEVQLALDVTLRLIAARQRQPENPSAVENQLRISNIGRKPSAAPMSRIRDLQYLLSSKAMCLRDASNALSRRAQQLSELVEQEQRFYGQHALALRHHNWPLQPRLGDLVAAILYVDYGFRKAGSRFTGIAEADVLRVPKKTKTTAVDSNEGMMIVPVHQSAMLLDIKFGEVSCLDTASMGPSYIPYALQGTIEHSNDMFSVDLASSRLAVFETELFQQLTKELSMENGIGRQARLTTHAFMLQLDRQNAIYASLSKIYQINLGKTADFSSRLLALRVRLALRSQHNFYGSESTGVFQSAISGFILGRLQDLLELELHNAIQPLKHRLYARVETMHATNTLKPLLHTPQRYSLPTWTVIVLDQSVGSVRLCSNGMFECFSRHSNMTYQHSTIGDVLIFIQVMLSNYVINMITKEACSIFGCGALLGFEKVGQSVTITYAEFSICISIAAHEGSNACFLLSVAKFSWSERLWLYDNHTNRSVRCSQKFMDDVQSILMKLYGVVQK
ncbi:hypothetical protein QVD99_007720 [Batrachochytrium dendrobatidis]|nr:hypothetical protein O5D80_001377 [Batrachochytrium dendrobatidis]KAK5665364.1 hypothetical protein QVD99_007720 [Batrachochytrium dendrobatidis]